MLQMVKNTLAATKIDLMQLNERRPKMTITSLYNGVYGKNIET